MLSLKKIYQHLIAWRYIIGFADYSDAIVLEKSFFPSIHWLKGVPKERWFADPFILSVSEKEIEVLVENYSYSDKKAKISIISVDKATYHLTHIFDILTLSDHLSFPAYFREKDRVFIYPEKCKSGCLTLFEFDSVTRVLQKQTVILQQPIADAVIATINGSSVIMGTLYPNDNGNTLYIYPFNRSTPDPFTYPLQIVHLPDNTARNAGLLFSSFNKVMIRPAQCCNKRYGECLVLQRVVQKGQHTLAFEEIKRVYSPSKRYNLSFHTFNVFQNRLITVDAAGYRYRLIGHILESIRNLFR